MLFHDPFALFSADWFVRRLDCQVVVLVRHPLSVVSGLKRLGWAFDFRDLTDQGDFMDELLSPFDAEIERTTGSSDIREQGWVLWSMVYETVYPKLSSDPSIHIVRHEDLSLDPEEGFRRLYELLRATFTPEAQRTIAQHSSSANPAELRQSNPDGRRLDSRANLDNWRHRLDDDEVTRIIDATRSVASAFYSEAELQGMLARGNAADG